VTAQEHRGVLRCALRSSNFLGDAVGAVGNRVSLGSILLAWAVDGHLDSDLATFNLLAIHLADRLLLHGLVGKGDETEAAALARFISSLELLDHETGNGAQGDLGGSWLVFGK